MTQIQLNRKNLGTFFYWIKERHAVYLKKESGEPRPWTDDWILRSYRFCNVFRELDTVTKWIRENWRIPYKNHKNLWFAMCVARLINLPSTLEYMKFPKDLDSWLDETEAGLKFLHETDVKIYGGAYIITAGGRSGPKYRYTMEIFRELAKHPPKKSQYSIQNMFALLKNRQGVGPFIAYEIASDLRWTGYYDGSDHMSWANPGPGAKRGISRLLWDDVERKNEVDSELALDVMRELLRLSPRNLPSWIPDLEMRDIEHSLCETDKYLRVLNGEGRMKAKYDGGEL